MDRQSFIRYKYLDENISGICGTDDCECDENSLTYQKEVLKERRSPGLVALSVMAFLSTIFFAAYKINAGKIEIAHWLLTKKNAVISCSPSNNDHKLNDHRSINNKDPADKNNRNGCTHQQGANSLCETTHSKRRIFKIHTC